MNFFVANPHFEWLKLHVGMAIFLTINSPGILHGQSLASESERDPVVITVLGPRVRIADRIAAYRQKGEG